MLSKRLLLGTGLLMASALSGASAAEIQAVRIGDEGDKTRVAIDLSGPAQHKLFTLSDPYRVVIDIKPAHVARQALPLPDGRGAVRQLRSGNRQDGSARIVLDLETPMSARSFVLAANGERGNRLVIDLVPLGAVGAVKEAPVVTKVVRGTGRDIVIAVDPGHGGKDPGAHGSNGIREKDVVLKISRQLAKLVDSETGMQAILTRNGDDFVRLRDRMERARRAEADLFISIHADSFRDRRVRGATVYVLSSKGAEDEAGRRLAARENAADLIGGVRLDDKDEMLASVLMDLSQNASLASSIDAGDEILHEIGRITKIRKGKVQQAPFLVLKSPDVPSVLIETAFISNPNDEKNLNSPDYQSRLAQAIFRGVQDYFHTNPPAGTRLAMANTNGELRPAASHVIRRGETLSAIANRYNVSIRRIQSVNSISGDKIMVGKVLRIPPSQDI
jgi:N-acetylmuramoyl-L-alanine amidase